MVAMAAWTLPIAGAARGRNTEVEKEIEAKWKSFDPEHPHPLKLGTLIKMVKDSSQPWPCDCHDLEERFEVCEYEVVSERRNQYRLAYRGRN